MQTSCHSPVVDSGLREATEGSVNKNPMSFKLMINHCACRVFFLNIFDRNH
jgi:hypothetical protein